MRAIYSVKARLKQHCFVSTPFQGVSPGAATNLHAPRETCGTVKAEADTRLTRCLARCCNGECFQRMFCSSLIVADEKVFLNEGSPTSRMSPDQVCSLCPETHEVLKKVFVSCSSWTPIVPSHSISFHLRLRRSRRPPRPRWPRPRKNQSLSRAPLRSDRCRSGPGTRPPTTKKHGSDD